MTCRTPNRTRRPADSGSKPPRRFRSAWRGGVDGSNHTAVAKEGSKRAYEREYGLVSGSCYSLRLVAVAQNALAERLQSRGI
jgi:hypothetical protein